MIWCKLNLLYYSFAQIEYTVSWHTLDTDILIQKAVNTYFTKNLINREWVYFRIYLSWMYDELWTTTGRQNILCYLYHFSLIPCKGCCLETSWVLEIESLLFMFKLSYRILLIISFITCDIVLWVVCFSFLLSMKMLTVFHINVK